MTITYDLLQTVGVAVLVFLLGRYIKGKVKFFQTYFIPAPVIGGLICSLLIFVGAKTGAYTIEFIVILINIFNPLVITFFINLVA